MGCASSPEEDREESAERLAEVPGVPGAWTAGSEELLGTTGGSRRSPPAGWLAPSEDRLSTLRAGDGVAEGGSECERREAWRAAQTDEQVGATPNTVPLVRSTRGLGHHVLPRPDGARAPEPAHHGYHLLFPSPV